MVEVMKIMATSFTRSHVGTATLSAPNPAAGHRRPTPLLETPGHSQASLGQSLVGSLLLSPVQCHELLSIVLQALCLSDLRELPDIQAGFRKGRGIRDQIANIR